MAQSPEYPDLKWMPPRSYTKGRWWNGQPTKITVHYTAGAEGYTTAEGGASYDQRRTDGTSAHYYVDADSVVQCVRTTDTAHTALYHGNGMGIHYELCGTAQSRDQWLDKVSRATIRNAARQMARDMEKYGIPLRRLSGRDVRSFSAKGVCGHVDWTTGWPEDGGTHTDPGKAFPWDVLFDDIKSFLEGEDVDLTDKMECPAWMKDRWDLSALTVATALVSGYGHARSANEESRRSAKEVALLKEQVAGIQAPEITDAHLDAIAEKVAARLGVLRFDAEPGE